MSFGEQKARAIGAAVGASTVRGLLGTMIKRPVPPAGSLGPASVRYGDSRFKTNPSKPMIVALVLLVLVAAVVLGTLAAAGAFSGPKPTLVPSAATEPGSYASLTDADALDQRYDIEANQACSDGADDYLRSLSSYEFKWEETGFFGHKFDHHLTIVQWPGVLTLKSEQALQQNRFGAFRRVTIWCNYDTQSQKVLSYK
jgi:hypothetical protein